ncbi:4'-phosphopantetheinyl transferase [Trabulsiella guamensis ATCC 49490]|uniref:Enterobactin synthase component D n=1 Tax=Trabulsiella guamensis ATCC 49490 TaxID=1005994 RepID=A0A085A0S5_9ENTR|nr:enterobactin synthase subunit EntD [Trabulsiella guamensis]KFC03820.1 4'-phosphopantetheinyl transferase [Trabulsiella guamensis ATCC 49490]
MHVQHHVFPFAGCLIHQIDFDPSTFHPDDLLWLPHHAQLQQASRKRQAEHLAGRIAAAHAINALTGHATVPGIGPQREPRWPPGIQGSISHCGQQALAVVNENETALVGIDAESVLRETQAQEIWQSVIKESECQRLASLPFPLGVTLAFSAKESLYKALHRRVNRLFGFASAEVIAVTPHTMTLALTAPLASFAKDTVFTLYWQQEGNRVLTLLCAA